CYFKCGVINIAKKIKVYYQYIYRGRLCVNAGIWTTSRSLRFVFAVVVRAYISKDDNEPLTALIN
ncbi:MAG: hypothetical protein JWR05_1403, partial [Mucilaginibacter sp.]|nr:hypothetical protein [Mucilaginibacter sp.]